MGIICILGSLGLDSPCRDGIILGGFSVWIFGGGSENGIHSFYKQRIARFLLHTGLGFGR